MGDISGHLRIPLSHSRGAAGCEGLVHQIRDWTLAGWSSRALSPFRGVLLQASMLIRIGKREGETERVRDSE